MAARVIVIGSGLSGLAAAYWLQQAGLRVQVLERLSRPGGRALTLRRQGYVIDAGPDALTSGYRDYLELMNAVGLSDCLVDSSPVTGVVRGHRVHDIDPSRLVAAVTTPALSWRAKWATAIGCLRLRLQLRQVDPFDLSNCAEWDDPDVDARQYALRRFGREVTDYLLDPAIRLTTGSSAHRASLLSVLGSLAGWTGRLINVKGGLDRLPRALAERVAITYGAEVTGVDAEQDGVCVEYRDSDGQHQREEADYCVIAAMYDAALRVWPPLAELAPDFNRHLQDVKLISISLGYTRRCNSEAYVVTMPTAEYPDVLLVFLQHNKAPDRAPSGHSLITLYTDTSATDKYLQRSDAELENWAAGVIEALFPELRGHRDLCEITRWPKAGYLAVPGFWRRSQVLRQALSAHPRIQLAGDLFGAGSMESAVRWGKRAAEQIIQLNQTPRSAASRLSSRV